MSLLLKIFELKILIKYKLDIVWFHSTVVISQINSFKNLIERYPIGQSLASTYMYDCQDTIIELWFHRVCVRPDFLPQTETVRPSCCFLRGTWKWIGSCFSSLPLFLLPVARRVPFPSTPIYTYHPYTMKMGDVFLTESNIDQYTYHLQPIPCIEKLLHPFLVMG